MKDPSGCWTDIAAKCLLWSFAARQDGQAQPDRSSWWESSALATFLQVPPTIQRGEEGIWGVFLKIKTIYPTLFHSFLNLWRGLNHGNFFFNTENHILIFVSFFRRCKDSEIWVCNFSANRENICKFCSRGLCVKYVIWELNKLLQVGFWSLV